MNKGYLENKSTESIQIILLQKVFQIFQSSSLSLDSEEYLVYQVAIDSLNMKCNLYLKLKYEFNCK